MPRRLSAAANVLPGRADLAGAKLFTPLFTPARFFDRVDAQNFQQTTAPQAQVHFAAELWPLYPRKRTYGHPNRYLAVHFRNPPPKGGVKNSGQSQYEL